MPRLLPYVDGLVLALLRSAMEATVTIETELSNPLQRTPYVHLQVVGGNERYPAQLGLPLVEIECYARGSKRSAADLAEAARVTLYAAWREQTVTPHGHLASFRTTTYPHEIRTIGQPPDVYRYTATYALGVRPPRR